MKYLTCLVVLALVAVVSSVEYDLACNYVGEFDYQEDKCACLEPYGGDDCSHPRKSKVAAFLLSFCFGALGADRFWLGYTGIGIAKLLLNLFIGIPACVSRCVGGKKVLGAISGCWGLGMFLFWIIDWSFILTNRLYEANGIQLYQDM
jgi:TM2 domain-containing membrane protein YozV